MHLLGIDVGTTGCKAVVFCTDGTIQGYGFCEYNVTYPRPGWAEQDPQHVWEVTSQVIRKAVHNSEVADIRALSLSVQGDAIIPVDKQMHPLHPTLLGMDYRSLQQSDDCAARFGGETLFQTTGMRPHPLNALTKVLWFLQNRPELYEKTERFMTYADFILAKLGAEPAIDYSMASRTMAFDILTKQWSENILSPLRIERGKFSRVVPSGQAVGEIDPRVAAELGLPKGVLLVSGGHDQACAALGAGVVRENLGIDSHGTAEVLSSGSNRLLLNTAMYKAFYPCYLHVKDGMYFTFALNHIGGILFRWYRDNLGLPEVREAESKGIDPYEMMISKTKPGPSSVFVLPHFNGSGTPWCDLQSRGAILGMSMATTRHDIVKAILDCLTYELRINLETMRQASILISELRTVGGAAKSPTWLQIKADITACPVSTLKIREAACLGAALLAGTAVKAYHSLDEGVAATVAVQDVYRPDPRMTGLYQEKYSVYKEIYGTLKDLNAKL